MPDDLAAALDEAHAEQSRALGGAIDHTLRFLPGPLSGIVRRVILGWRSTHAEAAPGASRWQPGSRRSA